MVKTLVELVWSICSRIAMVKTVVEVVWSKLYQNCYGRNSSRSGMVKTEVELPWSKLWKKWYGKTVQQTPTDIHSSGAEYDQISDRSRHRI